VSEFVVETRGLTKRFGDVVAVDDLTMRVRRGEVYGFLGPNGAGKTTTLRMLLRLARPSSGEAAVLDARPGSFYGPFIGSGQAIAVLAAYGAGFLLLAGLLLRQRDVG
jgi:ABC-type uncharacterized transport system ATPase subunit